MGRKKDNEFIGTKISETLNAVLFHGMAIQRRITASEVEGQYARAAEVAVNELMDLVMVPDKKDLN